MCTTDLFSESESESDKEVRKIRKIKRKVSKPKTQAVKLDSLKLSSDKAPSTAKSTKKLKYT